MTLHVRINPRSHKFLCIPSLAPEGRLWLALCFYFIVISWNKGRMPKAWDDQNRRSSVGNRTLNRPNRKQWGIFRPLSCTKGSLSLALSIIYDVSFKIQRHFLSLILFQYFFPFLPGARQPIYICILFPRYFPLMRMKFNGISDQQFNNLYEYVFLYFMPLSFSIVH
jgi:hypothetical protein